MTGHERWEELAAGHALSALEPEEEQEFLLHLRGCAGCERTLAELRGVAGQLAYAVDPAEPPPSLLASIREGIGASGRPLLAPPAAPRPRRSLSPPWLLAAAATVVILVLGLWNAVLRVDSRRKDDVIALRRQFEEMLVDPQASRVQLTGRGRGVAVVRDGRVMLLVEDLAASDPGSDIYVLWAMDRAGRPYAIEAFEVGNPDRPNLIPAMRLNSPDIAGFAVSREPGPEPPPAPSTPLIAGSLT